MAHSAFKKTGFALIFITLLSCGGGNDPEPDPGTDLDRTPMLINWVDNIIIPSYDNFNVKLTAFTDASNAFTNNPTTETLGAFRSAWVEAYVQWQKTELVEVGPGETHAIRNFINIYPADVAGITANFDNPTANLAVPAAYPRQGFPAFDFLINGIADTDAAIIELYTTDANAAKRIAYVKRITERMDSLIATVIAEWKGGYRETFISKTGLDIGTPTSSMVNNYVLHYERYIRTGKVGIPSGALTSSGGTKYPDKVEAYYKGDLSATLAKTAHQAAIDFFNGRNVNTGAEGPSFKTYLDALGAKDATSGTSLSTLINTQFAAAKAKLELLDDDFSFQVQNNNQEMLDAFTEMQKAVRMLKVDMTSAMSITITYTDNDGD